MSMKFGSTSISKAYNGSTEISKVYVGSDLIYQKSRLLWTFWTYSDSNGRTYYLYRSVDNLLLIKQYVKSGSYSDYCNYASSPSDLNHTVWTALNTSGYVRPNKSITGNVSGKMIESTASKLRTQQLLTFDCTHDSSKDLWG